MALNVSAARMPFHGAGEIGACQHKAPTGGAAKGMPLKTRTSGFTPATPEIKPESNSTGSLIAAKRFCATKTQTANAGIFRKFIRAMLQPIYPLLQEHKNDMQNPWSQPY